MRDAGYFPEGLFPDAPPLEALRERHADLVRMIYGREQGQENAFVILMGGGAATGKSTLAWHVAAVLGVRTVVSTDVIRQVLRAQLPQDDTLQAETWAVREGGMQHKTCADVYQGLVSQSVRLQPAIESMCAYFLAKGMPAIVEGIHLVPSLWLTRLAGDPHYIVFFVDAAEDRILLNYQHRAVSTHMRSSVEGFSAVGCRIRLHQEIVRRATASGLPVLASDDWPTTLSSALALVAQELQAR